MKLNSLVPWLALMASLLMLLWLVEPRLVAQEIPPESPAASWTDSMKRQWAEQQAAEPLAPQRFIPCFDGLAGNYPCLNIDLLAFLPLSSIGGGEGNDIWGWTDALTGKEYALLGRTNGTAFVDISDPVNPIYLGNLPPHTNNSIWRDIKVYADHAFIVSEAGGHGMQIFDLKQLRTVTTPPVTFSESAHFDGFGGAHNLVMNEETGYAYAVGANTCSGGLHMIRVQNPLVPKDMGCFSADGYTHDAQCVIYQGPDVAYRGNEICFNANEDTLTVVDVTDKGNPVQLARIGYSGANYAHQGWLTPDHAFFLLGDETDEIRNGHNTRTYIWRVDDLDNVRLLNTFTAGTPAIDHNLYIHDDYAYQANYRAGLRMVDITGVAQGELAEHAFFDIYPGNDNASFNGAWSNYPFFPSGVVIVSGIEQGLFILQPRFTAELEETYSLVEAGPGQVVSHSLFLQNTGLNDTYTLTVQSGNWPVSTEPTGTLQVAANTGQRVSFQVDVPDGLTDGVDTFTVTLQSQSNPALQLQFTGETQAIIRPDVSVSPETPIQSATFGETRQHRVWVLNDGNYSDTFTVSIADYSWPTTLSHVTTPPLGPAQSAVFTITVQAPLRRSVTPVPLVEDSFSLTAVSALDTQIMATASARTVINIYPGVAVAATEPQSGWPGETVTYTLTVTNTGDYTDTLAVSLGGNVWDSAVATTAVGPLAPNEPVNIPLTVTIGAGLADTVMVTVTSSYEATIAAQTAVTTTSAVQPAIGLSAAQTGTGLPGQTVTYTVIMTNNGNYTDTFSILAESQQWPVHMDPLQVGLLAPGESAVLMIHTVIGAGYEDVVTVTAVSSHSAAFRASTILTTRTYAGFLPLILIGK